LAAAAPAAGEATEPVQAPAAAQPAEAAAEPSQAEPVQAEQPKAPRIGRPNRATEARAQREVQRIRGGLTVPERRVAATQPVRAGRVDMPRRRPVATSQAAARPKPARLLQQLELSGAEIDFEIIGGRLYLHGPRKDLDQLERFIDDMRGELPRRTPIYRTLQNTLAEDVAPTLTDIFNQLAGSQAREEDMVSVVAEPRSNTLIIMVVPDRIEEVDRIIEMIENVPVIPEQAEMVFITLEHVTPDYAMKTIEELSTLRPGDRAEGQQPKFNMKAFPDRNQIAVSASEQDLDRIQRWIKEIIDVPPAGGSALDILKISLKNTEAEDLVAVLEEILESGEAAAAGAGGGGGGTRAAVKEHIRRLRLTTKVDGAEGEGIELNLEKPIQMVPDPNTNSVMVASVPENLEAMLEIVTLLDSVPLTPSVDVDIIMLNNADAENVVTLIKQMFDEGKSLPLKPGEREAELTRGVSDSPTGQALAYQISIAADVRTNAIVISGKADQLELVRTIVDKVDGEGMRLKQPLRLIAIENASASELVTTIQALLDQRETLNTSQGQNAVALEKVFIAADARSNSIIISAKQDNYDEIVDIVRQLDGAEDRMGEVRIINLEKTQAADIAAKIQDLWQQRAQMLSTGQGGKQDLPVIIADTRSNSLVIASSPGDFESVKKLIEKLEAQPLAPIAEIRIIKLEHNDASQVGPMLQQLFDQRMQQRLTPGQTDQPSDRIAIATDPVNNLLLVASSQENYDQLLKLKEPLDQPPNLMSDVRMIDLKKTQATDLVDKIQQMWTERTETLNPGATGKMRDQPVMFADTRSNSLVIASNKNDFEAIKNLVEQLELQPLSDAALIRVIQLKNNDAATVGPMLQQLFTERAEQSRAEGQTEQPSDRVAIATDEGNNLLLVACSPENYELIEKLIEPLDAEPMLEGRVETFLLDNANAEQMAETLDELFQGGVISQNPLAVEGPLGQARSKVTIVADVRANALIVSAGKEYLDLTRKLIKELDAIGVPRIYENMRMIRIVHADALRLQGMLDELFSRSGGGQNVDIQTQIVADDRTNTLVLWGSRDGVARAEELIRSLDVAEGTETASFVVYPLVHASAGKLGPMLQDLFESRGGAGGGTGGANERTPINIQSDGGSNSLVVSASSEGHQRVRKLLDQVDKPSTLATQMNIIPLEKAKAEPLATTLSELLEERMRVQGGTGGGGGGRGGAAISVQAEPRTNAIIIWSTPSDFTDVKEIVQKLDNINTERKVEMRLFRLQNSLAEDLANMLINHLKAAGTGTSVTDSEGGGGGGGGGEDEEAVLVTLQVIDPITHEFKERTLLRQDITVTPDAKSNTLMVTAPRDGSIDMLESLIRTLDEIKPLTAQIKVYQLQNASAEEMKAQLEELFQVGEFRPEDDRQRQNFVLASVPGVAVGGEEGIVSGKDEISFTVDPRTNSVMAAGSEAQLLVVEEMINRLDSIEIADRINRVLTVKYNEAPLIEAAVNDFIQAEVALLEEAGENQAAQRRVEREVTLVAQEDTNQLLFSVSPRYETQIMEMIRQLDQPPPMVSIDLLLVEVRSNEDLELGMEFALQDLLFSDTATVNANGLVKSNNFDFVGGTDVGASGSGALGGFSFTMTGEDFSFLLRTLKSENRLEVLSAPSITVQDGKEGNITIGENVPFVRNVNVTDNGQVQSQVEYENVGIILNVTPHINPDGFVNMELAPEISQITDSNVTITEGFTAPIFSERSAQTQVTIKDNETVIIGGLITTQEEERESKVPVLGDLPGIGVLFRATKMSKSRTELLLIITPHVVRSPDDHRDLTETILTEETPGINERVRDSRQFERLQRKSGDQLRGVPIPLMEETGNGSGTTKSKGGADRGEADASKTGGDVYGPVPDVYGPPKPARANVPRGLDDVTGAQATPAGYDRYGVQRR
jgi:type II secretion system protein D